MFPLAASSPTAPSLSSKIPSYSESFPSRSQQSSHKQSRKRRTSCRIATSSSLPRNVAVVVLVAFILASSFTTNRSMMARVAALGTSSSSATAKSAIRRPVTVHWFRHADLRLHDNPALSRAVAESKKKRAARGGDGGTDAPPLLLPIFCFDPRIFGRNARSSFGSMKCGPRRAQFVLDSVIDLRANLEKRGSGLIVARGKPEDVFKALSERCGNIGIFCQQEVASEELRVDKNVRSAIRSHGGELTTVWGSTLYDLQDLPFPDGVMGMPDVFTPFRNKVEKNCDIGNPLPSPSDEDLKLSRGDGDGGDAVMRFVEGDTIPHCSLAYMPTLEELGYGPEDVQKVTNPDPRGVMGARGGFKGGETAALARLKEYVWDVDLLKTYFDTRNGMLGPNYSTKFSPWLAHGCLSPREVAKQCRRYESTRVQNKSTYWVVFELLWRDFFKFFAHKHGNSIFMLDGTLGRDARGQHPNSRRWGFDRRTLAAWIEGRTGYPLVDANMRELAATGFMSNRGRQNVCSFLALDTNTDWRYGADYFEQELLDYDVYSNWGNWCSGAGMTGGRLNRFNIVKQSKDYDKDGDYVRHWVPELKDVPTEYVHEPWKLSQAQQDDYDIKLGTDYPRPIVQPFVPSFGRDGDEGGRRDGGNGGGNKRGRNNNRGRGGGGSNRNSNRAKGQRHDMKSLPEGTFRFK